MVAGGSPAPFKPQKFILNWMQMFEFEMVILLTKVVSKVRSDSEPFLFFTDS